MDQHSVGYNGRRLASRVSTGIFECNKYCKCDRTRCVNRVVQQGVSIRLQLFKTVLGTGWGVRCLDEVPRGSFVSTYTGELMLESEADEYGKIHGDEYFAQLDMTRILFSERKSLLNEQQKEAKSSVESNKANLEFKNTIEVECKGLPDLRDTPAIQKSIKKRPHQSQDDVDKNDMLVAFTAASTGDFAATYSSLTNSTSSPSSGNNRNYCSYLSKY